MTTKWTQEKIQALIDDEVEESLTLDYKAAEALSKTPGKKKEITKDVSAMANSAGGMIIYGVREFGDGERKHLPEVIDGVERASFTKETLEQVIGNIRPRIEGVVVESVSLEGQPLRCIYVVEIPQGSTAHQASDFRYYKRYNFMSEPMHDHEVRDVMGRGQSPRVVVLPLVRLEDAPVYGSSGGDLPGGQIFGNVRIGTETRCNLELVVENAGAMYAEYVQLHVQLPARLVHGRESIGDGGEEVFKLNCDNTTRDVVDFKRDFPVYGASRFVPILPGTTRMLQTVRLVDDFQRACREGDVLSWRIFADNAPVFEGEVRLGELAVQ